MHTLTERSMTSPISERYPDVSFLTGHRSLGWAALDLPLGRLLEPHSANHATDVSDICLTW